MEQFIRTEMIIGKKNLEILQNKCVMIFGCGGVGGFVVETLARCGVGKLILIDNDTVSLSNLNRQIIATHSTIGKLKTKVLESRIHDINPNAKVITYETFVLYDAIDNINFEGVDFIIDCIDTITGKLAIIEKAKLLNIKIISSMGTGNKLDPSLLKICDISKTNTCPLAKVMRHELRKKDIKNVPVLFSTEIPTSTYIDEQDGTKHMPASMIFVPSVAGIMIARYVIFELINN